MRSTLLLSIPFLLSVACTDNTSPDTHAAGKVPVSHSEPKHPTAMDQSNAKGDLDHVAAIRKAIVADDKLSMAAENVTVLAKSGAVTLRGTVPSAAERARVEELALGVAATKSIDNQIQIEPK